MMSYSLQKFSEISIALHAGSYRCMTLLHPLSNRDGTSTARSDLIKTADISTTSSLANGSHMGFASYKIEGWELMF